MAKLKLLVQMTFDSLVINSEHLGGQVPAGICIRVTGFYLSPQKYVISLTNQRNNSFKRKPGERPNFWNGK